MHARACVLDGYLDERMCMQNFINDLRSDPRYKHSLIVFMVENNLTQIGVTHFWSYVGHAAPILLACHESKTGRLQFGVPTTNDIKKLSVQQMYRMLQTLRIRFDYKLIGRNAIETKHLLKNELQNMLIIPSQSGDSKAKFTISGKHSGPDDVATCAMLGLVNQQYAASQADYKRVVPAVFQPTCETIDARL